LHQICFIYLANLIDLIVGVLMPLYTHLYNLMEQILLEETDHPGKTTILRQVTSKLYQQSNQSS
jgi:stage III sporulation protein SpoIIIAA